MHARRLAILLLGFNACGGGDNPEVAPQGGSQPPDSIACAADSAGHCLPPSVSLVSLLVRPEDYHGKRVQVMGFAHYEFESDGLYLHRDDAAHGITRNGLWLERVVNWDSLSDHYVVVEGTFDAQHKGHFGMWSGAIVKVTRTVTLTERSPPFARTE